MRKFKRSAGGDFYLDPPKKKGTEEEKNNDSDGNLHGRAWNKVTARTDNRGKWRKTRTRTQIKIKCNEVTIK